MIAFTAPQPGAWLREDIANILTALSASISPNATSDEVFCVVAKALGLRAHPSTINSVEVGSIHPQYKSIT